MMMIIHTGCVTAELLPMALHVKVMVQEKQNWDQAAFQKLIAIRIPM